MLEPLGVVSTARLFSGLHHHFMELLRDLTPEDWSRPTLAGSWTVRDVAVGVQRAKGHLPDGQEFVSVGAFTDVFRHRDGRWHLWLAHSIELPES